MKVTVKLNQAAMRALQSQNGLVGRGVRKAADRTRVRAKKNVQRYGRVRTGAMLRGIRLQKFRVKGDVSTQSVVATEDYSRYQHDGTGRIKAAPFLSDAIDSLRASDYY